MQDQRDALLVNGAGMLYYQGLRAFEIWMGVDVPESIADELFAAEFVNYLTV
jgi:shikimate 5-dehydrogenase